MTARFRNKVVVITGGARGLGLAMARCFAREGAQLVLLSRNEHELASARAELEHRGVRVETPTCDVRRITDVSATVAGIVERHGRIDVLVNNAGIIQSMPFEDSRNSDFQDSLDTHFWGPLNMIRASLPHMPHGSRIVNISSIGGRVAVPHLLPYCAGKAALASLSDGLHAELAAKGIAVTTVTPWLMTTGSHRNVLVRGDRRREAQWFALGTAVAAINADRAARQIVEACRHGRAQCVPGVPAKLAIIGNALAPALAAAFMVVAVRWMLPRPAGTTVGAYSRDLDLGWVARWLPTNAAAMHNQPRALGER